MQDNSILVDGPPSRQRDGFQGNVSTQTKSSAGSVRHACSAYPGGSPAPWPSHAYIHLDAALSEVSPSF